MCIYASCNQAKKHLMNRKLISSGSKFEKEIGYSRAVIDGNWIFVSGQLDIIMDLWDMELDSEVNTDQYTT